MRQIHSCISWSDKLGSIGSPLWQHRVCQYRHTHTNSQAVCKYDCATPLTSFPPERLIILCNPPRYFSVLPFVLLYSHGALPPRSERIPLCCSECFEPPSPNLCSEFIDLCSDLALSGSFVLPGFAILTTLGSHYANYVCEVPLTCELCRNINQE